MTTQPIEVTVNPLDIEVSVGDNNIEVTTAPQTIELRFNSVGTITSINSDGKFYFDGVSGNTYFTYNSTSGKLELWVDSTKQGEWGGTSDSDPFA